MSTVVPSLQLFFWSLIYVGLRHLIYWKWTEMKLWLLFESWTKAKIRIFINIFFYCQIITLLCLASSLITIAFEWIRTPHDIKVCFICILLALHLKIEFYCNITSLEQIEKKNSAVQSWCVAQNESVLPSKEIGISIFTFALGRSSVFSAIHHRMILWNTRRVVTQHYVSIIAKHESINILNIQASVGRWTCNRNNVIIFSCI